MMKNQKGITLIALVITIIVLLILAGVSIAMLTNENGILTRASQSSEQTKKAEAKEALRLAVAEILANKYDPTADASLKTITIENVQTIAKKNNENIKSVVANTGANGGETSGLLGINVQVGNDTDDTFTFQLNTTTGAVTDYSASSESE